MIRKIMHDVMFLNQKSEPATQADLQVGRDLQDTLKANEAHCVGMAANMIGVKKNIIIVNMGMLNVVMFNPVITKKSGPYETEEGCLSLIAAAEWLDGADRTARGGPPGREDRLKLTE